MKPAQQVQTLRENMTPTLGNLVFQVYRTTLIHSNNQFICEESCKGLQILNRNPLYVQISIKFGSLFQHLPDAAAIVALAKIAALFISKSPTSTPMIFSEDVLV